MVHLTRAVGTKSSSSRLQRDRDWRDWRQCPRRVGCQRSGVRDCVLEQGLSERRELGWGTAGAKGQKEDSENMGEAEGRRQRVGGSRQAAVWRHRAPGAGSS